MEAVRRPEGDNTSDAIVVKIREEIFEGTLRPGQKLKQTELSQRFGFSRTPVRDALKKLEAEGLITISGKRCAIVPVLDLEELQEVYRIRGVLEELAARLAAPRIPDELIEQLGGILDQMEKASTAAEPGHWLKLDYQFHRLFYAPCKSPRLLKLIDSFWNSTHHFRRAYCNLPERVQNAEKMHRRMLAAIGARDEELLGILTRRHIEESVRGILEVQPQGFQWLSAAKELRITNDTLQIKI